MFRKIHNPAHPCELLSGWLDDLEVSVTAFTAQISINRVMVSRILHRQPTGPAKAIRGIVLPQMLRRQHHGRNRHTAMANLNE